MESFRFSEETKSVLSLTISAVQFIAIPFPAITFWSKQCVITGIEGLVMSSGSVTNVTCVEEFQQVQIACTPFESGVLQMAWWF